MHYDTRQTYFITYSNSVVVSDMEYDFKVKEILVRNKWRKIISILKKNVKHLKHKPFISKVYS